MPVGCGQDARPPRRRGNRYGGQHRDWESNVQGLRGSFIPSVVLWVLFLRLGSVD